MKIIQAAMAACEPCIDIHIQESKHYAPTQTFVKAKSRVTSHLPCADSMFIKLENKENRGSEYSFGK